MLLVCDRTAVVVSGPEGRLAGVPTPLTELVGRRDLIDRVGVLLRRNDVRLATLTGPGGIGKTRVAIEVVHFLVNDFTDVWFVPLAATGDADLVEVTIGRALGVQEGPTHSWSEAVERRLTDGAPLLILDNFEQVLGAAPQLSDWLSVNPSLKLLVTSRAVLHLAGEHAVPVPRCRFPRPVLVRNHGRRRHCGE